VKAFRASGKKAIAYTDTFGEIANNTGAYYLATAFDEIYIQPSGDVNLTGLMFETPFARDAFAKLGVQPRIGARYEYKNAVNTYTEQGFTAPHKEAMEKLLGSLYGQMVNGIAEGRKLSPDEVKNLIDQAPHMGQAALDAKLVDGLLYRDEATASGVVDSGAGLRPAVILVWTNPGRTTTTRAPVPTRLSPSPWQKASRPALDEP
jgi:protease-4